MPDERMSLSFTIAAGPLQRSHSQVRVPRDSWPHFTLSDSRNPQPGGPGPHTYIPQEQGCPIIPPYTAFLFRRLLRLETIHVRAKVRVRVTLRLAVYHQSTSLGNKPPETQARINPYLNLSIMLRLPVYLGIKHPSGAYDQFLLLSDSCEFVDVGRSL
jgi:hypothetical protein